MSESQHDTQYDQEKEAPGTKYLHFAGHMLGTVACKIFYSTQLYGRQNTPQLELMERECHGTQLLVYSLASWNWVEIQVQSLLICLHLTVSGVGVSKTTIKTWLLTWTTKVGCSTYGYVSSQWRYSVYKEKRQRKRTAESSQDWTTNFLFFTSEWSAWHFTLLTDAFLGTFYNAVNVS